MKGAIIESIALVFLVFLGFQMDPEFAHANWKSQWEETLAAAKREGQVTIYISGYDAILPDFRKEYPWLKVVAVTGRGNQLGQRLQAERRAGKHLADVVSAGANPNFQQFYRKRNLDPINGALILPEVLDQSKWYNGRHLYLDPEGRYVFVYVGMATYGSVHYNTNLVDPKEFGSYWDLLEPKWRGKMEARDIRTAGPGSGNMRFFNYHPDLGPEFIKGLFSKTDLTLFRDFRLGTDWLAKGKFAICLFCSAVDDAKHQGLPVDSFGAGVFKEGGGLVQQFGTVVLMNRAPHPNAAKVFINWYLSRKGQIALQTNLAKLDSGPDSLRVDIPKDTVPPGTRRMNGVSYLDTGNPEWIDMRPIHKIVNQALQIKKKQ